MNDTFDNGSDDVGPTPAAVLDSSSTDTDGVAYADARWSDPEHEAVDVTVAGQRWRGVRRASRWGPSLWRWMDDGGAVAEYTPPPVDRRGEILAALAAIDRAADRPLRGVEVARLSGAASPEDASRLTALESEARALRDELARLPSTPAG